MVSHNTSMKTAYEFIKQYDPRLADTLRSEVKYAANRLTIAIDLKREREDVYDASIWQRLTQDRADVLRPFDHAIHGKQTMYGNCWDNLWRAVDDIDNENNSRKESEVEAGNFVYYIVDLDTNIRKTNDDIPIIYANIASAEYDCEGYDTAISVAEYNRIYGQFMEVYDETQP